MELTLPALLDEIALTAEEYREIVRRLGREPTELELGMFGAMWSEHCGYKNSKPLLRLFPTEAPWVLQGPGENAGVVDIGDVGFAPCYSGNPLVNAMAVGLLRHEQLTRARADGAGNALMLVGSDTGREGIRGCSGLASRELSEEREGQRPTVQVGNPFMEKLLIEACLELLAEGHEHVVGLQDLGAAGITSAAVEAAARGGAGVELDVLRVSRRERGMTPYEIMLSESQERMLVVVRAG